MRKELKAVRRKNVALFSAGDQVLCYHEDALFRAEVTLLSYLSSPKTEPFLFSHHAPEMTMSRTVI